MGRPSCESLPCQHAAYPQVSGRPSHTRPGRRCAPPTSASTSGCWCAGPACRRSVPRPAARRGHAQPRRRGGHQDRPGDARALHEQLHPGRLHLGRARDRDGRGRGSGGDRAAPGQDGGGGMSMIILRVPSMCQHVPAMSVMPDAGSAAEASRYLVFAQVAEADGNRTRRRRSAPSTGFEDRGDHQAPRRLRVDFTGRSPGAQRRRGGRTPRWPGRAGPQGAPLRAHS